MMRTLPAHLCVYYASDDVLQTLGPDVLEATKKCLMNKDGAYEALLARLLEKRVAKLMDEKQMESNGFL